VSATNRSRAPLPKPVYRAAAFPTLSAFWHGYPTQRILDEERALDRFSRKQEPPHHDPETAEEHFGICTFDPNGDTPPITRDVAITVLEKYPFEAFLPPIRSFLVGATGHRRGRSFISAE